VQVRLGKGDRSVNIEKTGVPANLHLAFNHHTAHLGQHRQMPVAWFSTGDKVPRPSAAGHGHIRDALTEKHL
jgi:hypothetical protein